MSGKRQELRQEEEGDGGGRKTDWLACDLLRRRLRTAPNERQEQNGTRCERDMKEDCEVGDAAKVLGSRKEGPKAEQPATRSEAASARRWRRRARSKRERRKRRGSAQRWMRSTKTLGRSLMMCLTAAEWRKREKNDWSNGRAIETELPPGACGDDNEDDDDEPPTTRAPSAPTASEEHGTRTDTRTNGGDGVVRDRRTTNSSPLLRFGGGFPRRPVLRSVFQGVRETKLDSSLRP